MVVSETRTATTRNTSGNRVPMASMESASLEMDE